MVELKFGEYSGSSRREGLIYINGPVVETSEVVFLDGKLSLIPSETVMKINLGKDSVEHMLLAADELLQHVAVMAGEGPQHPGFSKHRPPRFIM